MSQDISQVKATRIVGGVGCGKTQELIERVCSLLSNGEKAESVLALALGLAVRALLVFGL